MGPFHPPDRTLLKTTVDVRTDSAADLDQAYLQQLHRCTYYRYVLGPFATRMSRHQELLSDDLGQGHKCLSALVTCPMPPVVPQRWSLNFMRGSSHYSFLVTTTFSTDDNKLDAGHCFLFVSFAVRNVHRSHRAKGFRSPSGRVSRIRGCMDISRT